MDSLDVTRTLYRVSDFLSWQRAKSLVLSPSFQRRSVWRPGAKSYLIDTIVRGLPIPIIFMRDRRSNLGTLEPEREIVDGQQRIRTLITYINPSSLDDLDPERDNFTIQAVHNSELASKSFAQLSQDIQQRILDYQFSVHVLSSAVGDREVLSIFARMNSTGMRLNSQELRNAEFFGAFKTSMYNMASAQLQRWRDWQVFTEQEIARMQEVELTSEFAYLMMHGVTGKAQSRLNKLYKDKNKDVEYPEMECVEYRFNAIMDTISERFSNKLSPRSLKRKAIFYGLFASLYDLQFGLGTPLESTEPKAISEGLVDGIASAADRITLKEAPDTVLLASSSSNTNRDARLAVFKYLTGTTDHDA